MGDVVIPPAELWAGMNKVKVGSRPRGWRAILAGLTGAPGEGRTVIRSAAMSYVASGGADHELFKAAVRERLAALPEGARDPEEIARLGSDDGLDPLLAVPIEKLPPKLFSEIGNGVRFVQQHGHRVRFVPAWREWLVHEGPRWVRDVGDVRIESLAKDTIRSMYDVADIEDDDLRKAVSAWARKTDSRKGISSMIANARSEPGIALDVSALDADPWLLNCTNGTIDLRTGALRAHRPEDLITKLCPVAFTPGASHELWDRYVFEAVGGDLELAAYLQRWAGYAATGVNTEKAFALCYGPPDSGKSTFLDAVRAALGDYAVAVDAETWLPRHFAGGNRGDLARLLGVRLATTSEFKKGVRFDERLIKQISGGDPLTCSGKYEREIEFVPVCKLVFAANVAPAIDADDHGMWNRAHRIPLTHAPPQIDATIKPRLTNPTDGGPAVLAWMVEGVARWRAEGLGRPRAVVASTLAYRVEMDVVARFVAECCQVGQGHRVAKAALRDAFDAWMRENDRAAAMLTAREFRARFVAATGATEGQDTAGSVRAWIGVRLLEAPERPDGDDRPQASRLLDVMRRQQLPTRPT